MDNRVPIINVMVSADDPLLSVPLLSGMSPSERDDLGRELRECAYGAGEIVFIRGDPGDCLYLVKTGLIHISLLSTSAKERILARLGPGEYFGELALLDGEPRSAQAQAVVPSRLQALPRCALLDYVHGHPAAVDNLLATLAARLRQDTEAIEDTTFLDVPGRLARALLRLAEQHDTALGLRTPPMTQTALADLVGATRETVNRTLRSYERTGAIRREGNRVVIVSPERLRRRAA